MKTDVLYLLSNGFAARMILHSNLADCAKKQNLMLGVLCPGTDTDPVCVLARSKGMAAAAAKAPQIARQLLAGDLQRYLFENVRANPALKARHIRRGDPDSKLVFRLSTPFWGGVNRIAQGAPKLAAMATKAQRLLLRSDGIAEAIQKLNPRLVVATYPVSAFEAVALNEASKLGIETAIHLLSWDNITAKGRFPVLADRYISWGPTMTSELKSHYGVSETNIFECGVPHFDNHQRARNDDEIGKIVSKVGLDPGKPYLFFGMSSPVFAPREIDIVEWLAKQVGENKFGEEMQLLVRPHPQNVTGYMAEKSWLPRLQSIVCERVAVDIPTLEKSALSWNMGTGDLEHMMTLIAGASVSLNSGSTLAIDSILQDKPVVLTPFDALDQSLPWHQSARRLPEYVHLKKLIAMEGLRVSGSFEELEQMISAYLKSPEIDGVARAETRRLQCGPSDGKAAERVASSLKDIITAG